MTEAKIRLTVLPSGSSFQPDAIGGEKQHNKRNLMLLFRSYNIFVIISVKVVN